MVSPDTIEKKSEGNNTEQSHLFILTRSQQKWKEIRARGQIRVSVTYILDFTHINIDLVQIQKGYSRQVGFVDTLLYFLIT